MAESHFTRAVREKPAAAIRRSFAQFDDRNASAEAKVRPPQPDGRSADLRHSSVAASVTETRLRHKRSRKSVGTTQAALTTS